MILKCFIHKDASIKINYVWCFKKSLFVKQSRSVVQIPSMANNVNSFLFFSEQRMKVCFISITPNFHTVIKIKGNNCTME